MDKEAQNSMALQDLPAGAIVHRKLVVTGASGKAILKEIEEAEPTEALRALLRGGPVSHGDS